MPPRALATPPFWSEAELREARNQAEVNFRERRREEGPGAIIKHCAALRPMVEAALDSSQDLLAISGQLFIDDPLCWHVYRYFCGPPISEEDAWTLVGGPKFKRVPSDLADEFAEVISIVIDPVRFPWVNEGRAPSDAEREAAVLATVSLMANRLVATERRTSSSVRQESAIAHVLLSQGYAHDESRGRIDALDDMTRGTYSGERRLGSAKCDVPVRLLDGRLLAIEAKVSNGPKNGWKRLNRETGGKAETWRTAFGIQVVTAVVIAGVLDLSALVQAQNSGVTIFWEHDLDALGTFIAAAK